MQHFVGQASIAAPAPRCWPDPQSAACDLTIPRPAPAQIRRCRVGHGRPRISATAPARWTVSCGTRWRAVPAAATRRKTGRVLGDYGW